MLFLLPIPRLLSHDLNFLCSSNESFFHFHWSASREQDEMIFQWTFVFRKKEDRFSSVIAVQKTHLFIPNQSMQKYSSLSMEKTNHLQLRSRPFDVTIIRHSPRSTVFRAFKLSAGTNRVASLLRRPPHSAIVLAFILDSCQKKKQWARRGDRETEREARGHVILTGSVALGILFAGAIAAARVMMFVVPPVPALTGQMHAHVDRVRPVT